MTLRRLPDHIINQIAAGEVVGSPASVIKELLENAVDAGASSIHITIDQGGIGSIRVQDNGHGMTKDQLPLAILQHTTSKMPDEGLYHIQTLGFRGEALPSIGAVSRMTITSKHKDEDHAWAIAVDGGACSHVTPGTLNHGTCVHVQDLFYATPARLKFLKSPAAETHAIVAQVQHLALASPHIHIHLSTPTKTLLDLKPASQDTLQQRAVDILGTKDDLLAIDFEANQASVVGFIGVPTRNRRTSDQLFFLINDRCCHNRSLLTATRYAFGDLMPKGRFPVGSLWITMPHEDVDINAHPSKMDVRFRNVQTIRSLIEHAIKEPLEQRSAYTSETLAHHTLQSFEQWPAREVPPSAPTYNHSSSYRASSSSRQFSHATPSYRPATPSFSPPQQADVDVEAEQHQTSLDPVPPLGFPRCQMYKTFIISEAPDALIITDQHAAHERLVYERIKQDVQAHTLDQQGLLAPLIIPLSPTHKAVLEPLQPTLESWGFQLQYQDNAILVTHVPAAIKNVHVETILEDFFAEVLTEGTSKAPEEALHALCSTTACHTSIRAGQTLSQQEMSDLLRSIENTPSANQCNHGRPTHIRLSKNDMYRLFERT